MRAILFVAPAINWPGLDALGIGSQMVRELDKKGIKQVEPRSILSALTATNNSEQVFDAVFLSFLIAVPITMLSELIVDFTSFQIVNWDLGRHQHLVLVTGAISLWLKYVQAKPSQLSEMEEIHSDIASQIRSLKLR
jgi:hypothetical protein